MLRLALAFALAIAAALPAFARGPVDAPVIKPGDRWVYHATDGRRSLSVNSVSGGGTIDATIDTPGLSGLEIRYTRNWNVQMAPIMMMGNVQYQRYDPPVCLMPAAPWHPGQSWSCDANWSTAAYSGTVHVTGKLIAMDKITVPAGTFMALHAALDVGGTKADCWYAPKVRNWALCKSALPNYNYALTSYSLK
ncbi:MAG: hypothetical protein ACREFD_17175 [Stellaceae bacterium]